MKYNELKVVAKTDRKRVGRGIASGYGKTAGRGTKGQNARTGHKLRLTFTGNTGRSGANYVANLPKLRGFKSKRAPAQVVYADALNRFAKQSVSNQSLFEAGLIATPHQTVKVIAAKSGDPTTFAGKLNVSGASASVVAAITKNGGEFTKTAVPLPKASATTEAETNAATDES